MAWQMLSCPLDAGEDAIHSVHRYGQTTVSLGVAASVRPSVHHPPITQADCH